MLFPFEVDFDELQTDLDNYVDAVFGCLESEFLVMPKGNGFVEFRVFESGYEALKRATGSFGDVSSDTVAAVVFEKPIALIVLRCMLGFSPPEWAYYASRQTNVEVTQGAARTIDRKIRMNPNVPLSRKGKVSVRRIRALIDAACHAFESGYCRAIRRNAAQARKGRYIGWHGQRPICGRTWSAVFDAALRAPPRQTVCRPSGFHQ